MIKAVKSIYNNTNTCHCWKCGKDKQWDEMDHSVVFTSYPPQYQCLECANKEKNKEDSKVIKGEVYHATDDNTWILL